MQKSTSYYDLEVWQEAIKLAKNIYQITESFPANETYGLGLQLRRSAVSIASNLAEGQARNSHKEFLYFINISLGSLAELETQLIIAKEITLIDAEILEPIFALTKKITKMAHGLKNHLASKKK
ncbi:MAG: four helix bundle protein [Desulfobacca sp.]|uniref:four helix bundle protein n=1 Tax=Desulfobacca sp. TaxID=2067990 RepID=UPI00404A2D05